MRLRHIQLTDIYSKSKRTILCYLLCLLSLPVTLLHGAHLTTTNGLQPKTLKIADTSVPFQDFIHQDIDGDTTYTFTSTGTHLKFIIDHTQSTGDIELTLKKSSSNHAFQKWPTVTLKAGQASTVYDMYSGEGTYTYYLATKDGSPLNTAVTIYISN